MWTRTLADWFDGLIDEVRLSNEALDPCDVLLRLQPVIVSVLAAVATSVRLAKVHPPASAVKVCDITSPGAPVLLGTHASPGGASTVVVAVSPALIDGRRIAGT